MLECYKLRQSIINNLYMNKKLIKMYQKIFVEKSVSFKRVIDSKLVKKGKKSFFKNYNGPLIEKLDKKKKI